MSWRLDWLKAPDQMLKKQDPIAMALYEQYYNLTMPNMRLNKQEALALVDHIDNATHRVSGISAQSCTKTVVLRDSAGSQTEPAGDVVAIMNAWVREAHSDALVNAGYMTLINVGSKPVILSTVESEAFESIEMHETVQVDGLMEMRAVTDLVIPAMGQIHLQPGGKHLMLMGPRNHLAKGQTVAMTLVFQSGNKQALNMPVMAK